MSAGPRWMRDAAGTPRRWLLVRDGVVLAVVNRLDSPHWQVIVQEGEHRVIARCDRPGLDAAMLMVGQALLGA